MVLVTRSLVPGGLECILLGAFCHLPGQACSLPSPCRLRWREKLRTAGRCDHQRDGRRQGLESTRGTSCQAARVMRRLIICLLGCSGVGRKTKQKMGGRRMSKHTRRWSKPHDISSGLYKVPGHRPLLSLGSKDGGDRAQVKGKVQCLGPTR